MNYAEIKQYDVANGPGVRVSLFVSGCTHHCKECFNPETWDFKYGKPFTEETIQTILSYMEPEYVKGITLLGGEPLEHSNQKGLLPLVRVIKEKYPNKSIWCFTGYDFEKDILGRMVNEWEETRELLSYIEVLVEPKKYSCTGVVKKRKDLSLDTGSLKDRGKDYGFLVRYPE